MEESDGSVFGNDRFIGSFAGNKSGAIDISPDVSCIIRKLSRTIRNVSSCAQTLRAKVHISRNVTILPFIQL